MHHPSKQWFRPHLLLAGLLGLGASAVAAKDRAMPVPAASNTSMRPLASLLPDGFTIDAGRISRLADRSRTIGVDNPPGWAFPQELARAGVDATFDSPLLLDPAGERAWLTPRIFIRWTDDCRIADRGRSLAEIDVGFQTHDYPAIPGLSLVELDVATGEEVLAVMRSIHLDAAIDFVEPDLVVRGGAAIHRGGDPLFGDSWQHRNTGQSGGLPGFDLRSTSAWRTTTGSPDHAVLVIDTGAEESHPDLLLPSGRDFTTGGVDGVPGGLPGNECDNHGTPVAGCIAAIRDNGLGSVGIAPDGRTYSARCMVSNTEACDGSWWTQFSWTVNALDWAARQGVRVTNNSNYYGGDPQSITAAYVATRAAGMVHFASAGNSGGTDLSYPARIPSVHAVGAADRYGDRAGFSNYGPTVTVYGPGQNIPASDVTGGGGYGGGDYAYVSGTSFSSPLVAGVAALMIDVDPDLTPDEIIQTLERTCRDMGVPGFDDQTGWGLVQANDAIAAVTPECIGDFDGNGSRDGGDLGTLLTGWGEGSDVGDVDGDGDTGGSDLGLFLTLWGPCD